MSNQHKIEVYNNIHDSRLSLSWMKLQKDVFPQMHYEWIEPWCSKNKAILNLHIVAVVRQTDNSIVAIAPFAIYGKFVKTIKSIPVHFGDLYELILENSEEKRKSIDSILEYLKSFKEWDIVHIAKIYNQGLFFIKVVEQGFFSKNLTTFHYADLRYDGIDDFLMTLSTKTRGEYKRRLRRLSERGNVEIEFADDIEIYDNYFKRLKEIYEERWRNDYIALPSAEYYKLQRKVLSAFATKKIFCLILLKIDENVIAFRWGFIFNEAFFDLRVSYDPEYEKYYPGIALIGKSIEALMDRKVKGFNFGAGDYDWKRKWAGKGLEKNIMEVFIARGTPFAQLILKYNLKYKKKFKGIYDKLLGNIIVKDLSKLILKGK
jgi:hypothetical protein